MFEIRKGPSSPRPDTHSVRTPRMLVWERTKDEKANVRKSALSVLERIALLECSTLNLTENDLQAFEECGSDISILVRKQVVASLTR